MQTTFKTILAGAALALSMNANALLIDNFSTSQAQLFDTTTGDGGVWSSIAAPEALGGFRDIYVDKVAGGTFNPYVAVDSGDFVFDSPSGINAEARIRWDGTLNTSDTINMGLGGVNLLSMGSAFQLDVVFADLDFPFTLQVYTSATDFASLTLLSSGAGTFIIPFAAFSIPSPFLTIGGSGADFENVNALQAIINTGGAVAAVDLQITEASVVPEPGSLALLGLGLLGLGALRRRTAE